MVKIDGKTYDVPILGITRKAEFLDKHATRSAKGDLKRELIGVFFNYEIKFGKTTNIAEYDRLWDDLTRPEEFRTVTVPFGQSGIEFKAYFSNVSDSVRAITGGKAYYEGLSVNFIAKSPARR